MRLVNEYNSKSNLEAKLADKAVNAYEGYAIVQQKEFDRGHIEM